MSAAGIPTTVNHCRYRSRLEAKWATFFGLLGWEFQYEPFDLNGWIPDFLLIGKNRDVLVEVKPFTKLAEFDVAKIEAAMRNTDHWRKEVLLLGCVLPRTGLGGYGFDDSSPLIGWLGENCSGVVDEAGKLHDTPGNVSLAFAGAVFSNDNGIGFFHECLLFTNRITGVHNSGRGALVGHTAQEMVALWNEAGNQVQWNAQQNGGTPS